jgi:osmotically-inducible protein OsmY
MITKIVASFLLVFLLASVCLAADKALSDDAIVDQVRIKLASDADVKGGALGVDCKNGIVTITGQVENSHVRDKATKLAKKVRGVKSVVNNLTLGDKPIVGK